MAAPYTGLPAAASVQQSIILVAQLEVLHRLSPDRVPAARAVLLRR